MIYRFKSKADRRPDHDGAGRRPAPAHHRPRAGRARASSRSAALPAAIAALEQAIAAAERRARAKPAPTTTDDERGGGDGVSLRQRAWPLLEMMRRSHAEGADIVWGV